MGNQRPCDPPGRRESAYCWQVGCCRREFRSIFLAGPAGKGPITSDAHVQEDNSRHVVLDGVSEGFSEME
jgi:hypothetical protein